jgi:hypothetical protein
MENGREGIELAEIATGVFDTGRFTDDPLIQLWGTALRDEREQEGNPLAFFRDASAKAAKKAPLGKVDSAILIALGVAAISGLVGAAPCPILAVASLSIFPVGVGVIAYRQSSCKKRDLEFPFLRQLKALPDANGPL